MYQPMYTGGVAQQMVSQNAAMGQMWGELLSAYLGKQIGSKTDGLGTGGGQPELPEGSLYEDDYIRNATQPAYLQKQNIQGFD